MAKYKYLPFFPCFFRAAPEAHGGSQTRGRIRATAAGLHHSHSHAGSELCLTYTTAHGSARVLTHIARPGIEPASAWMLVRFLSAEARQEFPDPCI